MNSKKNLNQDDLNQEDLNKEDLDDLNDKYYRAQKELIRRRKEIKNQKPIEERFKKLERISRRKKKLKNFLKTIRINTVEYLKKCIDPSIIVQFLSLLGSLYIFREVLSNKKLSESMNNPSESEVHVDTSLTGQALKLWNQHRYTIVTGSGIYLRGYAKEVSLNRQIKTLEKKLITTENQRQETEDQLQESKKDFDQLRVESDEKIDSIQKAHAAKINKLHKTLNRLNNAVLQSTRQETDMRNKMRDLHRQIGELVEERDFLKEQFIELQKASHEKDKQVQDLNLEREVLLKRLSEADKEQADLTVTVEKLEKEKKAGLLHQRKLKHKLKRVESERQKLQEQLSETKTDLTNAKQDQRRTNNQIKKMEDIVIQSDKQIDGLTKKVEESDRALQKANATSDAYAKKMDETQKQIDQLTQRTKISNQKIEQQKQIIQQYEHKKKELEEEIDTLHIKLGIENTEAGRLSFHLLELERRQEKLADASKTESEELKTKIYELEKQIEVHNANAETYKDQLKAAEYELNDNIIAQQAQAEKIAQLEDQLAQEKDKSSQLESERRTDRQTFLFTLHKQREEQEQRFSESVSTSQTIINQMLDRQPEPWWQRIKINLRVTPSVTIKKDQKEVGGSDIHHFYPGPYHGFGNQALFPETITEPHTPGKDKTKGRTQVLLNQ